MFVVGGVFEWVQLSQCEENEGTIVLRIIFHHLRRIIRRARQPQTCGNNDSNPFRTQNHPWSYGRNTSLLIFLRMTYDDDNDDDNNNNNDNDNDDSLLINHHDACMYGRDLKLLEDPHAWLNDACLHYHFVCLSQKYDDDTILFWDPSVVFCFWLLKQDEFTDFARGYPTLKCHKLLLPLNDTMSQDNVMPSINHPALGTHWSLLLITFEEKSSCHYYYHFDSSRHTANRRTVHRVAKQWHSFWQYLDYSKEKEKKKKKKDDDDSVVHVQEMKTPQQTNGYDCGCHVLLTAQILAETKEEHEWEHQLQLHVTPHACRELRQNMAHDIRQRAGLKKHGS
jgi:sentrin-specific protease 8